LEHADDGERAGGQPCQRGADLGRGRLSTAPDNTFKLSTDRRFVEKLTDLVGFYLNPPDKALVLCVDEKL
jgi:hypothetical protein